jgi:hypothetical protein
MRESIRRGVGKVDLQQQNAKRHGGGAETEPTGVGAKLLRYIDAWKEIGRDYLIKRGLMPEWKDKPPPRNLRTGRDRAYTGMRHTLFIQQIEAELKEGIIEKVEEDECQWISPTFLVPKRGGEWRKVMDCRGLNEFIPERTFQMEDHRTTAMIINRDHYAVSLDITKAYHHIPVNRRMRPYLSFRYDGVYYQYKGMPFGIRNAPRVFSHVMHQAMTEIRTRWGIASIQYLDDLLFLHADPQTLRQQILEIAAFLQRLGWTINWEKSQLIPQQLFIFLGTQWNTHTMEVCVERTRTIRLRKLVKRWIQLTWRGRRVSAKQLA